MSENDFFIKKKNSDGITRFYGIHAFLCKPHAMLRNTNWVAPLSDCPAKPWVITLIVYQLVSSTELLPF